MVVTIPAGAPIPAPDISKRHLPLPDEDVDQTQNNIREAVTSIVSALDPLTACDGIFTVLNIESLLPAYLKKAPSPLELGVVRFSLREGVEEGQYHAFIDPGRVPTGYMHEAQVHATDRHQLPVLEFPEPRVGHSDVIRQILDFMAPNNVVFTLQSRVTGTQQALDWVAEQCGLKRPLLALPLEQLASQLLLLSGTPPSRLRLSDELQPQSLQHVTHIGCRYHASRDVRCCAVADSVRQAVACRGLLQGAFWEQLTGATNSAPALSAPRQTPNLPHPTTPCIFDVPDVFKRESPSEGSSTTASDSNPRYDQISPASKQIYQTTTSNSSIGLGNQFPSATTRDYNSQKPLISQGHGRGSLIRSLNSSSSSSPTASPSTARPGLGRASLRAAARSTEIPRSPLSGI